jgi:hypothetical protein
VTRLEHIAAAAVAGVGVATATTSFHALTELHANAGAPGWLAPMLPVAFDGMITAASMAVVAARRARRPAGYSWFLVVLYTTLSVAGNAIHAAVPNLESGGPLAAVIAATFPLTLFLSFEQLLRIITLSREHADPAPERADSDAGTRPGADGLRTQDAAPGTGRELVAALLAAEARAGRDISALTGPEVARATGLSVRRAQELLAELRTDIALQARNSTAGTEQHAGMRGGHAR